MKYVIYVRVSTEEQKKGLSLEMQKEICRAYVPAGCHFEIIEDSSSGGKVFDRRIHLKKAISMLDRGDVLLVYKLSRLTRDFYQIGHIMHLVQSVRASVISVTEKDIDRAMVGFKAVISDIERRNIQENTRNALQARKRAGYRVGRIPYGYQLAEAKKVVVNETEQVILVKMEYLSQEGECLRDIAQRLHRDGIYNREGKPFSHVSIHKILKNAQSHREAYSGTLQPHQCR